MPTSSDKLPHTADPTIDASEVARFELLAERWWEPDGPMAPLFKLNPTRIAYIRDQVLAISAPRPAETPPLSGLKLLDIGCGAGLLSEPMARLGANVTGIDAAELNIEIAIKHSRGMGLDIDYRHQSLEEMATSDAQYDLVLAMEILEHVADRAAFVRLASLCVAPGGSIFFSTLNRTLKSFSVAIVGAEYILNWLPRGTHDWQKFTRPSLLIKLLMENAVEPADLTGVRYSLLKDRWVLTRDLNVNYMIHAQKPKKESRD